MGLPRGGDFLAGRFLFEMQFRVPLQAVLTLLVDLVTWDSIKLDISSTEQLLNKVAFSRRLQMWQTTHQVK